MTCTTATRLAAASLLMMTSLAACEPGPTEVEEPIDVEIVTVASTLEVGSTLQVEARVTPSAVSQAVTWSSSDNEVATVSGTGLVEALLPGSVTIRATSVADPSLSDELLLEIIGCPPPRLVTGNLNSDTTWEDWIASPACFDYLVTANVVNQTSLLTIEPGVVVGFEAGRQLVIRGDAGLLAAGTAAEPIRITGSEQERGHWGGISLEGTEHPQNRLEHVTVEYGGGGNWSGSLVRANVIMNGSATTMQNATFRESIEFGLSMRSGSMLREHGDNTFTGNAAGPAHVAASLAHFLDATSTVDDNDDDFISVFPDAIVSAVTWAALGDGYHINVNNSNSAFFVGDGGFLTLSPGVTLAFGDDMDMSVRSGGALVAVGTFAQPIVFTGLEQTVGAWRGLRILSADSRNNLEHAVIEYAGSSVGSGFLERANLSVDLGANISVVNTKLRHGAGYGLYVREGARMPQFGGNVISGNAEAAAYAEAPVVDQLLPGNTYTGNGRDAVMVETYVKELTESATWQDIGVPLVVFAEPGAGLVVDSVSLTLEEGVEILFEEDVGLLVNAGVLTTNGTEIRPVLLSGDGAQWRGIHVARGVLSTMYTTLTSAGSSTWAFEPGAVTVTTAGSASSTVNFGPGTSQSGAPYGVVFGHGATFGTQCSRMAPIYVPPNDVVQDHCS